VAVCAKTEAQRLHLRLLIVCTLLLLLLVHLIHVLTHIPYFHDGRIGLGRNLYEIHFHSPRALQCVFDRENLGTTIGHKEHMSGTNLFVCSRPLGSQDGVGRSLSAFTQRKQWGRKIG